MSFRIIVLAKQVPDTRNVGKDAMKEDGTVNRAALPAIFNPEDLNALEMALNIKDNIKDATISIITMGPSRAAEIVREAMYRGADNGVVVSDRKVAGSDTLATSYTISQAIKKMGKFDIVIAGRQAIDGDTAQVGPQTAEKLDCPQITYAEEVVEVNEKSIKIKRRLERGIEVVESAYPCLITVHGSAKQCRSRHAKRLMKFKLAKNNSELQELGQDYSEIWNERPYLKIEEWSAADIIAEDNRLGLTGSPTKVKKIENVVLTQKESKVITSKDEEINDLMKELISSHIIG
ncbi:MAG: electron transfer flavoprotein subunit beta/FixA family protein [Bacteroidales bacterium]|nr:electron transfer flavoprotein subunit beta/FixA family protein [Bacteroidales bacterium]